MEQVENLFSTSNVGFCRRIEDYCQLTRGCFVSLSGNKFDDEWGVEGDTFITHSVPGMLSMANSGRNTKYVWRNSLLLLLACRLSCSLTL